MERDERHAGLCLRHNLFERSKRVRDAVVEVILVYLVREDDERVFLCELDEAVHGGFVEDGAGRIAGVDDDEGFGLCTLADGLLEGMFNVVCGGGPAGFLV